MFQVNDIVRRKPEWRNRGFWKFQPYCGTDELLRVTSAGPNFFNFESVSRPLASAAWDNRRFELVP